MNLAGIQEPVNLSSESHQPPPSSYSAPDESTRSPQTPPILTTALLHISALEKSLETLTIEVDEIPAGNPAAASTQGLKVRRMIAQRQEELRALQRKMELGEEQCAVAELDTCGQCLSAVARIAVAVSDLPFAAILQTCASTPMELLKEADLRAKAVLSSLLSTEEGATAADDAENSHFDSNIDTAANPRGQCFSEQRKSLLEQFSILYDKAEVKGFANQLKSVSIDSKGSCRYQDCQDSQRRAWRLLAALEDKETVLVGLMFAETLILHFSLFAEAEEVLRTCERAQESIDPRSIAMLKVKTWSNRLLYERGKYQSAALALTDTFSHFSDYSKHEESYWTVVYYLTRIYCRQVNLPAVFELFDQWKTEPQPAASATAKVLHLLCLSHIYLLQANHSGAETTHEKLRILCDKVPVGPYTAYTFEQIAAVSAQLRQRFSVENTVEEANHVYTTHFPALLDRCFLLLAAERVAALAGRCAAAGKHRKDRERILAEYYPAAGRDVLEMLDNPRQEGEGLWVVEQAVQHYSVLEL